VLLSNGIAAEVQGLVAVFAVVLFVVGFAFGLGAGMHIKTPIDYT